MGPNLVFRVRGSASRTPLHHRQILFSNDQILVSQTDGRTDRQTDAISIFWAFLVKNEKFGIYLGFSLPCGSDKYQKFYSKFRLWLFEQDPLCICSTVGFNSYLEAPLFVIFIILESTSSAISRKFATGTHRLFYRKDNEYQKLTPCLLANVGRSRRKRGF